MNDKGEEGWLIEYVGFGPSSTWWAGGDNWTEDKDKAIRFLRRVDADAVCLTLPGQEHILAMPVGGY